MNIVVPVVRKNVDLSVLDGTIDKLRRGKKSLIHRIEAYVALGELKGGIDPAGADEHWKTANSALERMRRSFSKKKKRPQTFFIGAAIENSMAEEIYRQLRSGALNNAANLTNDDQLTSVCKWIVNL
jgi:type II restriction enzyme